MYTGSIPVLASILELISLDWNPLWNDPNLDQQTSDVETHVARTIHRCDSETLAKDISGKTYIVTGANSGVGLETTRQLVKQGGHAIMACRRVSAGEEAAKSFAGLEGS